jgi:hypothetical protein
MPEKARKFRRRFGSPAAGIEEQNRRAAQIILAKAKPGDDGLAVQWARGILSDQQHAQGDFPIPLLETGRHNVTRCPVGDSSKP